MNTFKRFLAASFFVLISLNINAQVKTKTFEHGIPKHFLPVKDLIGKSMVIEPPAEFYKLKQEADRIESAKSKNQLAKFALPYLVNIDLLKEAILTESNGISTYALTIKAPLALNLSLHFNQFILSENSILSIYNDSELTDSITAKENNEDKLWVTRVYEGNISNIVLKLPSKEIGQSFIRIGSVYLGYKQFGGRFGSPGASESCNRNVACPLGVGWEAERNSIAIINGGNGFGSGVLVMNSCGTNIPYVLTAKHVLDQSNPVATWVFQFFYFSTVCAINTGFREDIQFNGATVKASSSASDFALIQLNQVPPSNSGINYAGWNRGNIFSGSFTGLHHPNGDVMKISRSFSALTRNAGGHPFYDPTQFWQVTWNEGITAQGSSGSPLFDQNHRIIGALTDGLSFCSTPNSPDWYGSFDRSWTGGGINTTRLSIWLDPTNSGAITTNTTNISNLIPFEAAGLVISGSNVFCTGTSQYTLNVPAGTNITWQSSNPNIATVSPTGNPATVTGIIDGTVTITATITVCGTLPILATKEINIGIPYIDLVTFSNGANEGQYFCTSHYGNQFQPFFSFAPDNSSVEYRVLSWPSLNLVYTDPNAYPLGSPIPMNYMFTPGSYVVVEIKLTTPCGSTAWMGFEVEYVDCSQMGGRQYFSIQTSPNPVSSDLYVTIDKEKNEVKALKTSEKVRFVLYDFNSAQLVKQWSLDNDLMQYKLSVAGIRHGQYILAVTKGKYRESTQIIIK